MSCLRVKWQRPGVSDAIAELKQGVTEGMDASARIVDAYGPLTVRGNAIVGKDGCVAMLRGISLFWSQWMPQYYNEAAIRWLRDDWKIDVVRAALGVHGSGYASHPARELRKIVRVIEASIDLGIYVIVDWHAHKRFTQTAGDFFSFIAREFRDYPNLIYETWNEPEGAYDWARHIRPYHERVIDRIREHDASNLIVVGTPHWSHRVDLAAADPLPSGNIAYSLHFYSGSNGQALRTVAQAALRQQVALMVTEWGTSRADASGHVYAAETRLWWEFLEQHGISYVNWSIADKDETPAALLPGASATGGWSEDELSRSGLLVRQQLRAMHRTRPLILR